MDKGSTYISILIQSLEKKIKVLDRIIENNKEQWEILSAEEMDTDRFESNLDEKGALIDELNLLDDGFQDIYDRIKDELSGNKEAYKEEIKQLQKLISDITEKSVSIRAEEEHNRKAAGKQFEKMRGGIQTAKRSRQAANVYYSNMSRVNMVDAQFMDKRK
ncbi:MAG: flagellar export chaperone FlgN [Lachnospiraceae bacterium]|nr:flagellar export chaperone FlgN [Lachnospiraceae bacterium]